MTKAVARGITEKQKENFKRSEQITAITAIHYFPSIKMAQQQYGYPLRVLIPVESHLDYAEITHIVSSPVYRNFYFVQYNHLFPLIHQVKSKSVVIFTYLLNIITSSTQILEHILLFCSQFFLYNLIYH